MSIGTDNAKPNIVSNASIFCLTLTQIRFPSLTFLFLTLHLQILNFSIMDTFFWLMILAALLHYTYTGWFYNRYAYFLTGLSIFYGHFYNIVTLGLCLRSRFVDLKTFGCSGFSFYLFANLVVIYNLWLSLSKSILNVSLMIHCSDSVNCCSL